MKIKINKPFSPILFYILNILLLLAIFFTCFLYTDFSDTVPRITEKRLDVKKEIALISSVLKTQEEYELDGFSFYAETDTAKIKNQDALPVLVNGSFCDVYSLDITGEKITKQMIENKRDYALISDTLSQKLFFTTSSFGKRFTLFDKEFTVVGVYKTNTTPVGVLSSDKYERVYLPYTAYDSYGEQGIDAIALSADNDSSISKAAFDSDMFKGYSATDFSSKHNVASTFKNILLLIFTITVCVLLIKIWLRVVKSFTAFVKTTLDDEYLFAVFKKNKLKSIKYLSIIVLLPVLTVFAFINGFSQIYILPQYLPTDNIFDISYTVNAFVNAVQNANSLLLFGNPFLSNFYTITFYLSLALTVITLILYVLWYKTIRETVQTNRYYTVELSVFMTALSAVLAVSSKITQSYLLYLLTVFCLTLLATVVLMMINQAKAKKL